MSIQHKRPPSRDPVIWGLAALIVVLTFVEHFFAPHHQPVFPWQRVPGYMALIGLFSCLIVVFLTKLLGKYVLQRPEDWDE